MRDVIASCIKNSIDEQVDVAVTVPEIQSFGHYATNVSFLLAKKRGVAPRVVAESIRDTLLQKHSDLFQDIQVAGAGFLNFFIQPTCIQNELQKVLQLGKDFGRDKKKKAGKIQIEYVSGNPTGPLTLANCRGGFLGDVISNIHEWGGYTVEREYYVNDSGNQVLTLGKSMIASLGFIPDEETFYKGEYVKEWADAHASFIKRNIDNPKKVGSEAAKYFLKKIQLVLQKKSGVRFDRFTSEEKDIHKKKYTEKVLALFREKGYVYEHEGAVWLKTTEFGDDKDRVLITSAGLPTYFLADAGHYFETVKRGFEKKILILGPDHYGYVSRIQAAAHMVGLSESEVLITQAIRLIKDGQEFKMSKRKGNFVTFEDLIEEVGVDAARFFFLMISASSHMDFDLGLAKERSQKNPVFYVQYALVRAKNILVKAKHIGNPKKAKFHTLSTQEDVALILSLLEFPRVLHETIDDLHVHRVAKYVLDLARTFHDFYEKERVLGETEKDIVNDRLALITATKIVFENAFRVLGISAPEKM